MSLPPPAAGTSLAPGASHLVEASTTEGALAEVSELLGPDARIIDARRVRRGGIAGFFAKEVVQLHATSADRVGASGASPSRDPAADTPMEVTTSPSAASPVDRLLADAEDAPDDVDFATYLRGQLTAGRTAGHAPAQPQEAVQVETRSQPLAATPDPARPSPHDTRLAPWLQAAAESVGHAAVQAGVRADAPSRTTITSSPTDGSAWSCDALLRLGLPLELVRSVERARPTDDLGWTTAVTEALQTSCRPLPLGPSVLVGPRAAALERATDLDGTPGADVDVEVARSRTWLSALREGRWVHLVVGGDGWRASLDDDPLVVSWTQADDLPDALRCAVELGLVLGYGPVGARTRRARPFDVALAVRDLVVGR